MRIQPLLLLSALPLMACAEDGVAPPSGPHYTYVVSGAQVPVSNNSARELGLDLDGNKTVDNALGMVLGTLVQQGFDLQTSITEAIDQGDIILLLDLQTNSFSKTSGAGLSVKLGDKDTTTPAPCTSDTDMTCRKHLDGNGMFAVASGSPEGVAVNGKIVGGTFNGGPGNFSLKIALGGPEGIQLDLIGARAKATGMSEAGISSVILAGALPAEDLETKVLPAIHGQIVPIIMEDCPNAGQPDCGCEAGSTGRTILTLFDTTPKNCMVTIEEIKGNSLIQSLLSPDVTINGRQALSLGLKVEAVKGTF